MAVEVERPLHLGQTFLNFSISRNTDWKNSRRSTFTLEKNAVDSNLSANTTTKNPQLQWSTTGDENVSNFLPTKYLIKSSFCASSCVPSLATYEEQWVPMQIKEKVHDQLAEYLSSIKLHAEYFSDSY